MDVHISMLPSFHLATQTNRPQLLSVSLLTIIALTATIVLHFLHGLNPTLNLSLNSLLAILWTISFALLSWWSSSTLSHVCNQDNWDNDAGIAVCRMYKALFSFSLLGLVATLVAVGLDVKVRRGVEGRGRFAAIGLIGGGGKSRVLGDGHMDEHTDEHEDNPNPTAAGRQARGGEGYALPDEQFGYGDNDTGYHGAAGQIGRRSEEHWI
jgi:hypothetical protein